MINEFYVKPEDFPYVQLRAPKDDTNENGIVNEPVWWDVRTDKPYVNPDYKD